MEPTGPPKSQPQPQPQPLHNFDMPSLKWITPANPTDGGHHHYNRRRSNKLPSLRPGASSASPIRQPPPRDSIPPPPPLGQFPLREPVALSFRESPVHEDFVIQQYPFREEPLPRSPTRKSYMKSSPIDGDFKRSSSIREDDLLQFQTGSESWVNQTQGTPILYREKHSRYSSYGSMKICSSSAEKAKEKIEMKPKAAKADPSPIVKRSRILIKIPNKSKKPEEGKSPKEMRTMADNGGTEKKGVQMMAYSGGTEKKEVQKLADNGGTKKNVQNMADSGGIEKKVQKLADNGGTKKNVQKMADSGGIEKEVQKLANNGGAEEVQIMTDKGETEKKAALKMADIGGTEKKEVQKMADNGGTEKKEVQKMADNGGTKKENVLKMTDNGETQKNEVQKMADNGGTEKEVQKMADNGGADKDEKEVQEEGEVKDLEFEAKVPDDDDEIKIWNLRPRKPKAKAKTAASGAFGSYLVVSGNPRNGKKKESPLRKPNKSGEEKEKEKEKKEKRKLSIHIALKKEEIEEDIYAFIGSKPSRRPKKRAKNIQKKVDAVFPGLWLASISPDSY